MGDSADNLPARTSASVGPTSVHVASRPDSASATVTVVPKATILLATGASTTRALRSRSVRRAIFVSRWA